MAKRFISQADEKEGREFLLRYAEKLDDYFHTATARLGTKISLYLVFAAFLATFLLSILKDTMPLVAAWDIGVICFVAIAFYFVFRAILLLLSFSLSSDFRMVPLPDTMQQYYLDSVKFFKAIPEEGAPTVAAYSELQDAVINATSATVLHNAKKYEEISSSILKASSYLRYATVIAIVTLMFFFVASNNKGSRIGSEVVTMGKTSPVSEQDVEPQIEGRTNSSPEESDEIIKPEKPVPPEPRVIKKGEV